MEERPPKALPEGWVSYRDRPSRADRGYDSWLLRGLKAALAGVVVLAVFLPAHTVRKDALVDYSSLRVEWAAIRGERGVELRNRVGEGGFGTDGYLIAVLAVASAGLGLWGRWPAAATLLLGAAGAVMLMAVAFLFVTVPLTTSASRMDGGVYVAALALAGGLILAFFGDQPRGVRLVAGCLPIAGAVNGWVLLAAT